MNVILESIAAKLEEINAVIADFPSDEPFAIMHSSWNFPALSRSDLVAASSEIIDAIKERGSEDLGGNEALLSDYTRRLAFVKGNTIPQIPSNPSNGVPAYLMVLDGLSRALKPALKDYSEVSKDFVHASKKIATRLRALEDRLSETEPRSIGIEDMLNRIQLAHETADQLPVDLALLTEDRRKVKLLLQQAKADCEDISNLEDLVSKTSLNLTGKGEEAEGIMKQIHATFAAATSQGLSAAFIERSNSLATTMWVWTGAFIVTLCVGGYYGTIRFHEIEVLLKNPNVSNWALGVQLFLATLSIGAPIWFGWMATKQINQRFRLSEDYAFKAAVSRAYEGYRQEAARVDKTLEAKLLASALTRLDEQPLRFVENVNHGSPWHELASSDSVKAALGSIPGFADKIVEMANSALRRNSTGTASGKDLAEP